MAIVTSGSQVFDRVGAAINRGNLVLAGQLLETHLRYHGDDGDALVALGSLRCAGNQTAQAKTLFERALIACPEHADARQALFEIAHTEQRFSEALEHFRRLPAPRRDQLLAHEANLLEKLGRNDEALLVYDRLIDRDPERAAPLVGKAQALRTLGRRDEAIAALRRATVVQRDSIHPWSLLSDLKDFRFDDSDIMAMTSLQAGTTVPADRLALHFSLAKALEDNGDFEQAFRHYAAANALRIETRQYGTLAMPAKVERVLRIFTANFVDARRASGHPSKAPIFIVGMQRSGSTLIEQILASHPLIEGPGELTIMPQLLRSIAEDAGVVRADAMAQFARLDYRRLKQLGQLYLDRSNPYRRTDRPYFIDKLPGNWSNVGLIRLILPRAKIIDARRHPMAVGFSNFKQNYAGGHYTNKLATIGQYYRTYLRLMTHFERVTPGAIYRVVNEELIDDFEPQVRALLDFIGVPFDPACLAFHTNARPVATPSAEQVRRPINRDGIGQWRNFEPWLDELKQALGPALDFWNLPPGTYRDEED